MVSVDRDEDKRCPIDMVGRCRSGGHESPAGAFSAPTSCVTPLCDAATGVMNAARRLNGVLRLGECAERAPRGAFELDCRRVPFLFAEQGNGCAHQVKTIGRSVA